MGLAGGQYFDLTFEKKNISKKNIIEMQRKKTGELFGFCCESIAIIKGLDFKKRKSIINKLDMEKSFVIDKISIVCTSDIVEDWETVYSKKLN